MPSLNVGSLAVSFQHQTMTDLIRDSRKLKEIDTSSDGMCLCLVG